MNDWLAGTPLHVIPGATVAGLVSGTLLPLLGMWVVMQRVVFLGVTLAQVAAAGVALGLFLHLPPLPIGLLLCGALAALATRPKSQSGEGALGAAFCAASALSLLFISRSAADLDQVQHVLHGNLIYAGAGDVKLVASALLAGLALIALFFKEILFTAFDRDTARALGLATRGWLLLLFGVLAVVLTVSMRTTGSLLTFAMLVLPPLAALQLRKGLLPSFILAGVLGFLGTLGGLLLAVAADLHLESSITVALFLLIPLLRAWRVHPLLALALAAALGWLAPALKPETQRHEEPTHAPVAGIGHAAISPPYTIDVHVSGNAWSMELHRDDPRQELPPALWLVLDAGGTTLELPMVEDSRALPAGDLRLTGSLPMSGEVPLSGQVWTGPPREGASEPVGDAQVHCGKSAGGSSR